MSTKAWGKIDKFIPLMLVVLVITAGFMIYVFREVFSVLSLAHEVEIKQADIELRINKDQLSEAYGIVFEQEIVTLETE